MVGRQLLRAGPRPSRPLLPCRLPGVGCRPCSLRCGWAWCSPPPPLTLRAGPPAQANGHLSAGGLRARSGGEACWAARVVHIVPPPNPVSSVVAASAPPLFANHTRARLKQGAVPASPRLVGGDPNSQRGSRPQRACPHTRAQRRTPRRRQSACLFTKCWWTAAFVPVVQLCGGPLYNTEPNLT